MPDICKIVLAIILLSGVFDKVEGQELEYLNPVLSKNFHTDSTVSFFVSTTGLGNSSGEEKGSRATTIQLIDADKPWPPRWYAQIVQTQSGQLYRTDKEKGNIRPGSYLRPKVIDDHLLFVKVMAPLNPDKSKWVEAQFDISCLVLNKKLEQIDSMKSFLIYGGKIDAEFRKNDHIQQLSKLHTDSVFNLSAITGNPRDSATECIYDIVHVLDQNDNVKYTWNPLEHFDLKAFKVKEKMQRGNRGPALRLEIMSSVDWDYDGDILYNVERVGIGKISKTDGHVLWHYEFADMPIISGRDTFECYMPNDFKYCGQTDTSIVYSLFDNGDENSPKPRAVVFEKNKRTSQLKVLKYLYPAGFFVPGKQSEFGYNLKTGNYVMDYGTYENDDKKNINYSYEYGKHDSAFSIYRVGKSNSAYGISLLQNLPRPSRPVVIRKAVTLEIAGGTKDAVWYKLEGPDKTKVTKIGEGPSIKPEKGFSYCVVVPYGMGYSVSKPVRVNN